MRNIDFQLFDSKNIRLFTINSSNPDDTNVESEKSDDENVIVDRQPKDKVDDQEMVPNNENGKVELNEELNNVDNDDNQDQS